MKEKLKNRIIQILIGEGCFQKEIAAELDIILADYDVTARHTEIMVLNEDENQMLIRRFFTAKIVKGLSERTLDYYKKTIDEFLRRAQKNITEITSDDIRLYIAIRRRKDKVTDTTAGNELRNLRSFFNWLYTEELIKSNPMAKVESIKKAKIQKEAFTEYEVELIRGECCTARETAIIEILLSTGCRVSELVNIQRKDTRGDSILVHGKGNKDRFVYLNARAQIALKKYMAERKDESRYIFPKGISIACADGMRRAKKNWYKIPDLVLDMPMDKSSIEATVRKIGKRAGVKKAHPHRFRRTCATFALRRGMPIEQVSRMLGHEQISTTQIYLDLSEKDLEQAHRKYVI